MNKLYVIRFLLSNDYVVSTWYTWNEEDLEKKMSLNPEWTFTEKENNSTHRIMDAR